MSHQAKALVLHCMDFRFIHDILHEMKRRGLNRQYDDVSLAGGAKNLVDPMQPYDREMVGRQIDVAKKLHGITEVYLINHLDCGAYGKIFASPKEEYERHVNDLRQARQLVTEAHGLNVHLFLAKIDEGRVSFTEVAA